MTTDFQHPPLVRFKPVATWVLIGLNLLVWAAIMLTGSQNSPLVPQLALVPGMGLRHQWVTSAFTHVGIAHLGMNMLSLYFIGPALEQFFGHARYLAIYIASMLGGSALVAFLSPTFSATLGASGCIFGLLGTYLVLALRHRQDLRGVLFWLIANLIFTFTPGVSWQGHIGGLLAGTLASVLLTRPQKPAA